MTTDSEDISMLPRTFLERREWFGQFDYVGYHIPLTPIDSPRWHKRKHWLRIQEIFELARIGDFTNCEELLAMNDSFPSGNNIYFTLLGDIATSQTIQKITEKATAMLSEDVFPVGDFRDYVEILSQSVGFQMQSYFSKHTRVLGHEKIVYGLAFRVCSNIDGMIFWKNRPFIPRNSSTNSNTERYNILIPWHQNLGDIQRVFICASQ